jgi:hypothetical protein
LLLINPEHYRRGRILATARLLTFEATELATNRTVYIHMFPAGKADFRAQLTNDVVAWLSDELRVEDYKGATYVTSAASPEYLNIESYIREAVEIARSKYETAVTKISEPVDNETAEYPTTAT